MREDVHELDEAEGNDHAKHPNISPVTISSS